MARLDDDGAVGQLIPPWMMAVPQAPAGGARRRTMLKELRELLAGEHVELRPALLRARRAEYASVLDGAEPDSADAPPTPPLAPAAGAGRPAVTLKVVPEFGAAGTGEQQALRAVVSLQAAAAAERPAPLAVAVAMDTSRSMHGGRFELAKATLEFLVNQLGPSDTLALVSFGAKVVRELPMLPMRQGEPKRLALAVNDALPCTGGTPLHGGLMAAIQEHAGGGPGLRRVRSVFLMSDGQPNEGPRDVAEIVAGMRAKLQPLAAAGEPLTVNTFGIGAGHDAQLMQAIAEAGGGLYYEIAEANQIPEGFGDALGGLMSVVATDVRVEVTALAAAGQPAADGGSGGGGTAAACHIAKVESGGVLQEAQGEASGKQVCIKFADVLAEENKETLLHLELGPAPPAAADGADALQEHKQQLLKVVISYCNPATGAVSSDTQVLEVARSAGAPAAAGGPGADPLVMSTAARFQAAEAAKAASKATCDGRFDRAEALLREAATRLARLNVTHDGEEAQAFARQLDDMATTVVAWERTGAHRNAGLAARAGAGLSSMSSALRQQRGTPSQLGFATGSSCWGSGRPTETGAGFEAQQLAAAGGGWAARAGLYGARPGAGELAGARQPGAPAWPAAPPPAPQAGDPNSQASWAGSAFRTNATRMMTSRSAVEWVSTRSKHGSQGWPAGGAGQG